MKIKHNVLTFLFALTCLTAYSQKCKFETNEQDPFSGKEKKVTKTKGLYSASDLGSPNVDGIRDIYFSLKKEGDEYSMRIDYRIYGERNKKISITDSIYLRMENGVTVTLNPSQEAAPISAIAGASVITDYSIQYQLSDENLNTLGSSILTHFKCNVGESPESVFKLNKKYTIRTQQYFNCVK